MKSIRDRLAVLLMLCLLVWGAVPALAAETVDETRIGSIKVLLCDTETAAPLQGGELTLYWWRQVSYSKSEVVRMRNKLGNALIALGVLALLAAVLLMGYNQWDSTRAEKAADRVLTQLEESIAEPRTIYPGDAAEPTADTEMPVGTIDGYDYIGYLSIPSIGLALPVMQQWSYPGLKIAPGRYSGSLYTDDLVIAGHNYARHFSPLTHLTVGTEVLFVDMNDNTWHYAVSNTEVLQPTQIEEMAVKTPDSNWDLTLFTCTTTGQARYALRCVRTDE